MSKEAIEDLTLRTSTAGNVKLWCNSDKIGLYTDSACEKEDKVVENEDSVEGSRRATFSPTPQVVPPGKDIWGAEFRTKWLWAKALETSDIPRDIQPTLSPVSGKAASDVANLTIVEMGLETVAFH